MPVPKRRTSRSRQGKRRSHWKVSGPPLSICPQCHQPKRPHRVCPHCGYYHGRKVASVK